MKVKSTKRYNLLLYFVAILSITSFVYSAVSMLFTGKEIPTASAQTDPFLDRRINLIEQRFITLESRLNRLEQESRITGITPSVPSYNNDLEINALRSQIDALRLRVGELECGLLKLDERTLSETSKQARKKATASEDDPCRLNTGSPLKLSVRP